MKHRIQRLGYLYFSFLLLICGTTRGGTIQWASEVAFEYNSYDTASWSGLQAVGPPDARPLGQLNPNAFRIRDEAGFGKIIVGYQQPIRIQQIIIVENYLPGRISKISVFDELNNEYLIHNPKLRVMNIQHRILSITLDKTPFPVKKVAINLSTYHNPGWAQIDAIGICEQPVSNDALHDLEGDYNYIFNEQLTFIDVREKLGPNINSDYNDIKPLLSPDGRTMYFVREYSHENTGGQFDPQDIYYSNWINERWTVAQNMGEPLNDEYANGICTISPDGNTMWVQNFYNRDGTVEDGLSVTHRTDTGWSKPQRVYIQDFHNNSEYQDYYISNNGRILILAVERNDSYGDQDLYVSFLLGENRWSKPRSLGPKVNSPMVEYAPFIAPDNLTLFFSSNGHSGTGDSDIYFSKRLDDSWSYWTEPEPLSEDVNTEGWDGYFTLAANAKYAFFVTDYSDSDPEKKLPDRDIYSIGYTTEPMPANMLMVKGIVKEKGSRKYVEANVLCNAHVGKDNVFDVANENSGRYKLILDNTKDYSMEVIAEGYMPYSRALRFTDTTAVESPIVINIELTPLGIGHKFQINDLFFVQSRSEILPESLPTLDNLALILRNNPTMMIELGGHTDNIGSKKANLKLSKSRAESVKAYLIESGISESRLKTTGYGSKYPKFKNSDPESRRHNRRVEVKILKV
jgi:outer membrane protein OmpA-like peptidoglycan-associated protein